MQRILISILALFHSFTAAALTVDSIDLKDQIEIDGKPLKLNGHGFREATIFKVKVYLAALYLQEPSKNPEEIIQSDQLKKLEMHFLREVDKGKINDAWAEGFKNHCGQNCDSARPQLEKLQSLMVDVKKGDTLSFTFYPDKVVPEVKGEKREAIEGAEFSKILLQVWLGKKPPNKSLKQGLLGL